MLKGKSTVQLFDAATGAKLLEQSDTNMVTNALEIIANTKEISGILNWWRENNSTNNTCHEHAAVSPFLSMVPLYRRSLGGVLLWDDNITEDPSVVIPPSGASELGHAGTTYSGADIYRGTYNSNESGEIEGGYRHVWDFDTDKANGTIKCISLTSRHAGNIGYHGCFSGDVYPRYNHCYFHSDNAYYTPTSKNYGIQIQGETTGTAFYLRKMEDGSLRLYKKNNSAVWYVKLPDPSKLTLFTSSVAHTDKVTLPITLTNQYATLYVYQGQIHEIAVLSTSRLQHRIFSLEGEQISSKTLDLSITFYGTSYLNPAVYRDGYYYCFTHNDGNIVKVDGEGMKVSTIPFMPSRADVVKSVTVSDINGEILFGLKLNSESAYDRYSTYTMDAKDVVGTVAQNTYPCAHNSSSVTSPPYAQYLKTDDPHGLFVFFYDPYYSCIIPLVNTGYLATINNLQMPITKTAAQTMKITYEIYDE